MGNRKAEIQSFIRSLTLTELSYTLETLMNEMFSATRLAKAILDSNEKQIGKLKVKIDAARQTKDALRKQLISERHLADLIDGDD